MIQQVGAARWTTGNNREERNAVVLANRGKGVLSEGWVVFGLSLIFNALGAYLVAVRLNIVVSDVMQRTVQAWLILAGNTMQLPSIDNALPTMLNLPLVLLEPLREGGIWAGLLTAFCGSLTCSVLNRILSDWNIGRRWRYPMLVLFALNPMILFQSSNGSSEMIFVLLIILSLWLLLTWHRTDALQPMILLGFVTGLAALTRVEALVYAVVLLGIVWLLARQSAYSQRDRAYALLIAFFTPVIFTVGAWILSDALITNVPLYFIRGANYDSAQFDHWLNAILLRDHVLIIPFGFIVAGKIVANVSTNWRRIAPIVSVLVLLALGASTIASGVAMAKSSEPGEMNDAFLKGLLAQQPADSWKDEREIASYLREHAGKRRVLVDDPEGYRIIFFTHRPELFITAGDVGFEQVLRSPIGRIDYVLVRTRQLNREAGPSLNREEIERRAGLSLGREEIERRAAQVNKQYPRVYVYEGTDSWISLIRDWPASGWRLYRVSMQN